MMIQKIESEVIKVVIITFLYLQVNDKNVNLKLDEKFGTKLFQKIKWRDLTMRKMKKFFCSLVGVAMVFGGLSNTASALTMGTKPADNITYGQPFMTGTAGSEQFRIPCLVTLDDGTIVAGCDARWTTYRDGGGLDTIVSYSKDKGETWNYTFANYLGDNGNIHNEASTAFIDPAMATDGENVWLIADLYPAGIALNGGTYQPLTGHTGFDANHNLALKKGCQADTNGDGVVDVDVNGDGNRNVSDYIANVEYSYSLVKKANATNEDYYQIIAENGSGAVEEGYTIDAWFNITGTDVDTNLFCSDSPYHPYPTDFLYKTKSEDGGQTWSIPSLIDVKKASEQTILIGPGRGIVTSEGRIVFTAYEFTSGDKNSCCIYSDDGGETWTRGASVSGWSSEAVVTEADGKLYMFTRHGRAYYVSEDWGETWGDQKSTGLSYNDNCQLTAITYSKKIDGKTAIIFGAPSNTGTRAAGKLFIGLVQDDGSLDWKYTYSINGSAFYAYSCLAELNDGTVGLLYENDSSKITYINLSIDEIVPDAVIGNIYLTDSEDNITTSYTMSSNKTVSFNINGLAEGTQVSVESSNEDILTADIDGTTLTITSKTVSNLEQATVKVTFGEEETVIKVNIVDKEQYEIVELRPGETKTFKDITGNDSDTDLSSVNTDVAKVTVAGINSQIGAEVKAQLATAVGTENFNGDMIDISKCLYTFTSTDTANQYHISGTDINENTVYLSYRTSSSGPIIGNASAAPITLAKHGSEAKFSIQDTTTGSTNGSYLYFHEDETDRLHFNRNSSINAEHCYFELYTPSADAPADSLISGYKKVTDLDEIKNGERYLIVTKEAGDGNRYVMNPSLGTNAYNHVARITGAEKIVIEAISEGNTFVKIGDVTYYIIVENEEGKTEQTVDKTGLQGLYNANIHKEQGNYTYSSWKEFVTALANALDVLKNADVAQEDIDSAKTALESSIEGLREKGIIPLEHVEASVGNSHPKTGNDGGVDFAIDGNPSTMWHTTYNGTPNYDDHWFRFKLKDGYDYEVNGLRYLPRQGNSINGLITKYVVEVSNDGEAWTKAAEGEWSYPSRDWKVVKFEEPMKVKYVRLKSNESLSDTSNKLFTTAAEVRLEGILPADYTAVDTVIAKAEALDRSLYTEESLAAVDKAVAAVVRNLDIAEQEIVDGYVDAIENAIADLQIKEITYSITYQLKGGKNSSKNPTSYTETTSKITLKDPTRTGYDFDGWYSDSKYKNRVKTIKKGSTGDKVLYAKWIAHEYSIAFKGNGSTSGSMKTMSDRKYGKSYTLSKNTFKRKGYTFVGWNTKKDGSGTTYADKASVKNLTSTDGKKVTLYAKWKAKKYDITYKLNGGKNSSKNPSGYNIEDSKITLKSPTRKGYTFKGWYSDAKYTKRVKTISKGSIGNKTLYAKWSKK